MGNISWGVRNDRNGIKKLPELKLMQKIIICFLVNLAKASTWVCQPYLCSQCNPTNFPSLKGLWVCLKVLLFS